MTSLFDYQKDVQRLTREAGQDLINPSNIVNYVNIARREVAMRSQCLRVLPNISGAIETWSVTAGGTGYSSSPTLAITAPDFPSGQPPLPNGAQATASAVVAGGVITGINSDYGGSGYFQPIMTITDTTGTGATATANLSPMNLLNQGQERYDFSSIDLSAFPGMGAVYFVRRVCAIYANYRYDLPFYSWSEYQAYIRQYPFQYQYVPTMCAQFGQGTQGSLYFYPIPSQTYQMEWDCLCIPQDLSDDQSYEALPSPWSDAVKYFAAALCFEELSNLNAAGYYHQQFENRVQNYSNYARVGRAVNMYGRR